MQDEPAPADAADSVTERSAEAQGAGARKSPSAFRTISEVSDELGVPQHVLRFWETKFSQVRPLKRGGGRRYYRPEDLALLRRIKGLLYDDGYTIRGVQKLLRDNGVKAVLAAEEGSGPLSASALSPGNVGHANGGEAQGGLSEESRAELREILAELHALRDLLRGAP